MSNSFGNGPVDRELSKQFGLPAVGGDPDFYDPFMMDSAMFMPRSLDTFWDYAFHLFYLNQQYRHAWHRLSAYFATGVEFKGKKHGDDDEQIELRNHLINDVDVMGQIVLGGMEVGAYGNTIFTWAFPFDRVLIDTRSDLREYPLGAMKDYGEVRYHYKTMEYEIDDPKDAGLSVGKRRRIRLPFMDRPSRDSSRLKIQRLDLREMHLLTSASEHSFEYIRRFSPDFLRKVRDGDPFYVSDVPMEQLVAVAKEEDFLYNEDSVIHIKMPTIRGLRNFGWGIPETFANYRSLHHIQVLRRIDEAVGKDYLLPLRMWVPQPQQQYDDMSRMEISSNMRQIISEHRRDPYAVHSVPFPMTLIEPGTNGKTLVQSDQIEYHMNAMLGASGLPVDLYNGSMQIQNIPSALRLFEGTWQFMYYGFDKLIRKTAGHVQDVKNAARIDCLLKKSDMADDIEERGIYLSLVASGEISRARGYGSINIDDPLEERKKRMREDAELAREDNEMQKQMQMELQAGSIGVGQPGAGGQAGYGNQPGGGGVVTPQDAAASATQQAQTLLQMDTGSRMKELAKLRATDPNGAYPLVKQKLEELRAQGASQGRAAAGQQQQ